MELFLISDTIEPNNQLASKLNECIAMYGNKIAYISSSRQAEVRPWFLRTWDEYKKICPQVEMEYFDLSDDFSDEDLKKVLNFKIMHLSGGNTFKFLQSIRRRKFEQIINDFVANNNLVIGVSAGAIIMTPTVQISEVANDINDSEMTDLTGLKLVDFEFYPHFNNTEEEITKIENYSKNTKNAIYICDNQSGIYIIHNHETQYGNVRVMMNGKFLYEN